MSNRGGCGLVEMEPIFRQMKPEWSNQEQQLSSNITNKPFTFHVHTSNLHNNNSSSLCISVTDFHSNTFQVINSGLVLEDMREMAGIGGHLTNFVDYLKEAFTSEDLKLVLEGQSKSGGAVSARLIAQKSDGMPTISISLNKLVDAAASEAMASITVELLKLYTKERELLIDEQSHFSQLTRVLAAEQEKHDVIQEELAASVASQALDPYLSRQEKNDATQVELDSSVASFGSSVPRQNKNNTIQSSQARPQKYRQIIDLTTSDALSRNTSDRQTAKTTPSSKVTNPVVPACHRETFKGIIVIDSDDERD